MRSILLLPVLSLGAAAAGAPPQSAVIAPQVSGAVRQSPDRATANCRDRIVTARTERGLPKLPGDAAKADDPVLIAAVARSIDGCDVLVMRDNTSDFRPLPEFGDGPGKVFPLKAQ